MLDNIYKANKSNMRQLEVKKAEDQKKQSWMRKFLTCFGICSCVEMCLPC